MGASYSLGGLRVQDGLGYRVYNASFKVGVVELKALFCVWGFELGV